MVNKKLSLENLKINEIVFSKEQFKKIIRDLEKIGFFDEEESKGDKYCEKIFSILRKSPDYKNEIGGYNYIREDYLENEKFIKSKIYDFNLRIISTCS